MFEKILYPTDFSNVAVKALPYMEQLRYAGSSEVLIKTGNPASRILKVAHEEQVSIIIIGSHGKTNLAEMLIGSVSERVVRYASCPVLMVKR